MNLDDIAAEYATKSDADLAQIVVANYDLSNSVVEAHPGMSQDAGFELFDAQWAKRYWRNLAAEISGLKALDKVQSWAVGASISGVAKLIIDHYSLPAAAVSAAVALAVILIRAANTSEPRSTT